MEAKFGVLFSLSIFLYARSLDLCDKGWIDHGGSCFTFIIGYFTWQQAEDICRSQNANQASIHTIDRQLFLHRVGRMLYGMATCNVTRYKTAYWISARDNDKEGQWLWEGDGKSLASGYTNWNPGRPHRNNNSNCAYFHADSSASHWFDSPCNYHHGAICEKSVNLTNAHLMFGFGR